MCCDKGVYSLECVIKLETESRVWINVIMLMLMCMYVFLGVDLFAFMHACIDVPLKGSTVISCKCTSQIQALVGYLAKQMCVHTILLAR